MKAEDLTTDEFFKHFVKGSDIFESQYENNDFNISEDCTGMTTWCVEKTFGTPKQCLKQLIKSYGWLDNVIFHKKLYVETTDCYEFTFKVINQEKCVEV